MKQSKNYLTALVLFLLNNMYISRIATFLLLHKVKRIRRKLYVPKVYTVRNLPAKFCKANRDSMETDLYYCGIESLSDRFTLKVIARIIAQADYTNDGLYIDVGADIGKETIIPIALSGSKIKVISFEPLPKSFSIFHYNIELNDLADQVTVFNFGLAETSKVMSVDIDRDASFPSFSLNRSMNHVDYLHDTYVNNIEISLKSGDEFFLSSENLIKFKNNQKIERIDLIKIDVETYEPQVIQGFSELISLYKPPIIIEVLNDTVGLEIENSLPEKYIFFNIDDRDERLIPMKELKRVGKHALNYLLLHESNSSEILDRISHKV
jgi:FkbM family methyltransferase